MIPLLAATAFVATYTSFGPQFREFDMVEFTRRLHTTLPGAAPAFLKSCHAADERLAQSIADEEWEIVEARGNEVIQNWQEAHEALDRQEQQLLRRKKTLEQSRSFTNLLEAIIRKGGEDRKQGPPASPK